MKNLKAIRQMLAECMDETSLCGSQTYYPAEWRFGVGVGDASTSARGDCRLELAAMEVARRLGIRDFQSDAVTQREASLDLFESQCRHEARLAEREAAANE